jgi:LysM repeat protein
VPDPALYTAMPSGLSPVTQFHGLGGHVAPLSIRFLQNQADAARAIKHTVQRGESLSQIAKDYGVATAAIVRANNLANPNSVYTGQVLIIPQSE